MIAKKVLGVFEDIIDHLDEIAPSDTMNPSPSDYKTGVEDKPDYVFLTEGALPPDPSKAAIIGLIDEAIPFAHSRLRVGAEHSRIGSIWLQDVPPDMAHPVGSDLPFGRELRGGQISQLLGALGSPDLLTEDALYRKVGAIDFRRSTTQRLAFDVTHGSAISGIAAGFDPTAEADLAQSLPVMAVCLPSNIARDTLGTVSPLYIMFAILFIIHRARRLCRYIERKTRQPKNSVKLPVVINLSFGLTAGPKDGSSLIEKFQDAITNAHEDDIGPITFVLPMGNHRQARLHAVVEPNASTPLEWEVKPDDQTSSFLEIWGPRRDSKTPPSTPLQIECSPPGATKPITTTLSGHADYQVLMREGREVARAYLQYQRHNGGGREVITLAIPPTRPERVGLPYGQPGRWQIRIISDDAGPYDIYVQRDETLRGFGVQRGRQSRLIDDLDPIYGPDGRVVEYDPVGKTNGILRAGTINAFATGYHQMRVGGCYASDGKVVAYSSLDFEGSARPMEGDAIAPAETSRNIPGVLCMGTASGSRNYMSGTSLSAPQITRDMALNYCRSATT